MRVHGRWVTFNSRFLTNRLLLILRNFGQRDLVFVDQLDTVATRARALAILPLILWFQSAAQLIYMKFVNLWISLDIDEIVLRLFMGASQF